MSTRPLSLPAAATLAIAGAGLLASGADARAASHFGGPDGGGYVFRDSLEIGGPAALWVDSTSLVPQATFGDDSHVAVTLPAPFTFYGVSYDSIEVDSNGYVVFGSTTSRPTPETLPTSVQAPALYPWWQDWDPTGSAAIAWGQSGSDFVVSWDGVPYSGGGSGLYQFQLWLRSNGSVLFVYKTVAASDTPDNGALATIGIEKGGGGPFLQYHGGTADPPLLAGLVIEFRPCVDADADGDGVTECGGDCQDARADVAPGAEDAFGDDVDQNCDGADGVNTEPDPSDDDTAPGDDDTAGEPGCEEAESVCDDGVDNDCDGRIDALDGQCVQACGWKPAEDAGGEAQAAALPVAALAFGLFRRLRPR
ncbi:putative metal-binding motif-containing protein [Myxococcota bacterium]|nr:putative metal-binding motif-containing protein [Myxococcota bacterium]